MLLEAERERSRAVTDARIAQGDAAALTSRLHALEGAAEAALERWEASEMALSVLRDASARLREQQTAHFTERATLQDRRICALSEQLARAASQAR